MALLVSFAAQVLFMRKHFWNSLSIPLLPAESHLAVAGADNPRSSRDCKTWKLVQINESHCPNCWGSGPFWCPNLYLLGLYCHSRVYQSRCSYCEAKYSSQTIVFQKRVCGKISIPFAIRLCCGSTVFVHRIYFHTWFLLLGEILLSFHFRCQLAQLRLYSCIWRYLTFLLIGKVEVSAKVNNFISGFSIALRKWAQYRFFAAMDQV